MESDKKAITGNTPGRRKFVARFGAFTLITAVAAAMKFPFSFLKRGKTSPPVCENKTITMLTQDGRLVQVNEALLTSNRKKATSKEIQNWIKKCFYWKKGSE